MRNQNKTLDSIIYAFSIGWWCDPILGIVYRPDGEPAKQYISTTGYFVVNLPRGKAASAKSTWKSVALHRVIAYCRWGHDAFAGHNKIQVRHLDGVRTNNSFDNLAIGTPKENMSDMSNAARSSRSAKRWASMTDEQKSEWRLRISKGFQKKRDCISEGMRELHVNDTITSRARMEYAREVRYGRIDKNIMSFVDFCKAQQAYVEGKGVATGPSSNP